MGSCRARDQFDHWCRHLRPSVESVRPCRNIQPVGLLASPRPRSVLVILCFAEVGSRFDATGGPYLYARMTFGPLIGFQVGWLMWLGRIAGVRVADEPLRRLPWLLRSCGRAEPWRAIVIVAVVSALAIANIIGVRVTAAVTNVAHRGKTDPAASFGGRRPVLCRSSALFSRDAAWIRLLLASGAVARLRLHGIRGRGHPDGRNARPGAASSVCASHGSWRGRARVRVDSNGVHRDAARPRTL